MTSSIEEAAALYSSLGWALTKLDGKKSIGQGWQNTQPVDPESARSIWAGWTGNMGLVLGPSGVIDYELDSGDEDLYWSLVGGRYPQTPVFITGSGMPHILFRDPSHLTRRTRAGFELRAGPHQSVIPPSVHPDTGRPYQWVNHPSEYELQDPPAALLEFFAAESSSGGQAHWREPLRNGKLGPGQGRHASLISFLGRAVNLFETQEQLVAAGLAYAEETQDPPYPEETIRSHAYDVWHRYREEPEPVDASEASLYLGIKTLDKLTMRSVEFLWKPFLQRAAFHLLVGRKGAGKGSILAWLASQVTVGQMGPPAPVLWIATEDSFQIDVKPRFVAQGGDPSMFLTVQKRIHLPQDIPHLEAVCQEHGVGLVVIDPIVGVIDGADSNAEGPIVKAIGGLNDLADRLDLSVVGVRHIGKRMDSGVLEAVLGSAAWVNIPRAVVGIAQDEDNKIVTLQVLAGNRTRSRDSYDFHLVEETVPGLDTPVPKVVPKGESFTDITDIISRQPKGKKYTAVRDLVLEAISDHNMTTKDALMVGVRELGTSKATLDLVCKDLKEEGLLEYIVPPKRDEKGKVLPGQAWYMKSGPLAGTS